MKLISTLAGVLLFCMLSLLGCATNQAIHDRNVLAAQQATDEYKVYAEAINSADSDTSKMAIALAYAYRKGPSMQNVVTPIDYMKASWGVVRDTAHMIIPFIDRGDTESSTTVSAGGDVFMNSSKADRVSTIQDVEGVSVGMSATSSDDHTNNQPVTTNTNLGN